MPDYSSLVGVNALVTGGAAGIGRGVAEKLRTDGASMIIADLDATAGDEVAAQLESEFVGTDTPRVLARECRMLALAAVGRSIPSVRKGRSRDGLASLGSKCPIRQG